MLSISAPIKGAGRGNYYLDLTRVDYYANTIEQPGQWFGHGTRKLALEGPVEREVFLNLLKNAKEAMPKGGTLTIRTEKNEGRLLIHIRDSGVGIPEGIRNKIFEAFFTTKQKVKGVGLGLSVCYGIIRDHDGEIKVESQEGKGTIFSISLPT